MCENQKFKEIVDKDVRVAILKIPVKQLNADLCLLTSSERLDYTLQEAVEKMLTLWEQGTVSQKAIILRYTEVIGSFDLSNHVAAEYFSA